MLKLFKHIYKGFFVHRALELASGGLLILSFCGRWTNVPTMEIDGEPLQLGLDFTMEAWEASWEDLILEVGDIFFLFNDMQQLQCLDVIFALSIDIIMGVYT